MFKRRNLQKRTEQQLLQAIYNVQRDWKQLENIVDESIEPSEESIFQEKVAQAKFMFLLREARHLNIHAIKYY